MGEQWLNNGHTKGEVPLVEEVIVGITDGVNAGDFVVEKVAERLDIQLLRGGDADNCVIV